VAPAAPAAPPAAPVLEKSARPSIAPSHTNNLVASIIAKFEGTAELSAARRLEKSAFISDTNAAKSSEADALAAKPSRVSAPLAAQPSSFAALRGENAMGYVPPSKLPRGINPADLARRAEPPERP
jgi:hypothetical protein